jgi:hypothetical protein
MNQEGFPKFFGSRSVASRNRLPRILATNAASVTPMGTRNPALGRSNPLRLHRTGRRSSLLQRTSENSTSTHSGE